MKNTLLSALAFLLFFSIDIDGQKIQGDWYGQIEIEGITLKVAFHLQDTSGYWQGTMDIPNTGAYAIQLDTTIVDGDSLFINSEKLNSNFSGQYFQDKETIIGDFQLYGTEYILNVTRDSFSVEGTGRPQEPTSVDYYVENVVFGNYKDSIALSGTVTMPFDPNINKAVVLVSGGGPQNRDHDLLAYNHRPFLVLSDFLTKNGIAVLRYDDRGIEKSSGNFFNSTTKDFSNDAQAAVDYLRSRIDLKGAKIGILGIDEGGIISGMIGDSADFNIMMATPGIKITDLMLAQNYLRGNLQGIPDTLAGINFRMYAQVYNYIKQSQHLAVDTLQKNLMVLLRRGYNKYPSEIIDSISNLDVIIKNQAMVYSSPWYRYYLTIEPSQYLKNIKNPVMAMIGTLDMEVPYQTNLAGIEAALMQGGNENYQVFGFNGVNHYFQAAISGVPSEYRVISETMNNEVMATIADWINALP